jgi:hypothetical protein
MVRTLVRALVLLVKMPFRAGVYTCLLGLGAGLGVYGPTLWDSSTHALAWFNKNLGDEAFDPTVLVSPAKELDVIRDVRNDVAPRLRRAQCLLRAERTEIAFISEKCKFIEERVPRAQGDSRPAEQILTALAEAVSAKDATAADRELFESIGGPTWVSLRARQERLSKELASLIRLEERVQVLQGKLEERRLATLRYVPDAGEDSGDPQGKADRKLAFPEIEESRQLLETLHEDLFRVVHALSPDLVSDSSLQAAVAKS